MRGTEESAAYLGGIGAMLEVSDVCPACGQVHEPAKYGLKHRAPRECPLVVVGSFPVVSLPNPPPDAPIKVPTTRRVRNADIVASGRASPADALPIPLLGRDIVRGRSLGVPWLPPPDLGEVY